MTLRKQGADFPLEANQAGRYVSSVVASGEGLSRSRHVPSFFATRFLWAFSNERPNLANEGLHLPCTERRLYRFEPPRTFSACKALTLGGAMDGCPSDPGKIILEMHVRWVRASAQQLSGAPVSSDGENML